MWWYDCQAGLVIEIAVKITQNCIDSQVEVISEKQQLWFLWRSERLAAAIGNGLMEHEIIKLKLSIYNLECVWIPTI